MTSDRRDYEDRDDEPTEIEPYGSPWPRRLLIGFVGAGIGIGAFYATRKNETPPAPKTVQETPVVRENSAVPSYSPPPVIQAIEEAKITSEPETSPTATPTSVEALLVTVDEERFFPTEVTKAREELAKLLKASSQNDRLLLLSADIHAWLGGRKKREEWIRYAHEAAFRWREDHPRDPRGAKALALAYIAAGQFGKALPLAQEAVVGRPQLMMATYAYGVSVAQGKSREEGTRILEQGLQAHPKAFPIREALAELAMEKKDFARAAKYLKSLLEDQPSDPLVLERLAESLEETEQWKDTIELLRRVSVQEGGWNPRYRLAHAYRRIGQYTEAARELDPLLGSLAPSMSKEERGMVVLERGKVEFDRERYFASLVYLKEAERLRPKDLPTLQYLAGALYRDKRYKESAEVYTRALALSPGDVSLKRYLGMAQLEAGLYTEAEQNLREVVLGGDRDPSLDYHLARIREAKGDRAGAIAYLRSALAKKPDYANAQTRLEALTR